MRQMFGFKVYSSEQPLGGSPKEQDRQAGTPQHVSKVLGHHQCLGCTDGAQGQSSRPSHANCLISQAIRAVSRDQGHKRKPASKISSKTKWQKETKSIQDPVLRLL